MFGDIAIILSVKNISNKKLEIKKHIWTHGKRRADRVSKFYWFCHIKIVIKKQTDMLRTMIIHYTKRKMPPMHESMHKMRTFNRWAVNEIDWFLDANCLVANNWFWIASCWLFNQKNQEFQWQSWIRHNKPTI